MLPESALSPRQKASTRALLHLEGGQKPVSSPKGISQAAATVCVTEAGRDQAYLVAAGGWGHNAVQSAAAAYEEIARELKKRHLQILHERVFGSLAAWPTVRSVRRRLLQSQGLEADGPLTYIQGQPPWGKGLSGVIIRAVKKREPADQIWTVRDRGWPVGRGWQRQGHTTLILQNLQGLSPKSHGWNRPHLQARRLLAQANRLLREQGATYRDVVRTWFYLADILSWYPDFNQARSAAYRELGLLSPDGDLSRKLPASTGIEGHTPTGAAGALDILAVIHAENSQSHIRQLSSPGQPEAISYGSAFSRGALICEPEASLFQVSGTAAIDEHGQSLCANDIRAQIDCTFEKIEALVGQADASLADVAAASVFVKYPQHAQVYWERAAARGLQDIPAVVMVADICRTELLFEMDAEVVIKR
jgi:enamine deaminase RidA (YjgF/YER057c/UK114 family)